MALAGEREWDDGLPVGQTMTISAARERLTRLPEDFAQGGAKSIAVTRRGEPVLAVMPWELYESIVETLEILGDEEMMAALRRSIEEIRARRGRTSDELRRRLGL